MHSLLGSCGAITCDIGCDIGCESVFKPRQMVDYREACEFELMDFCSSLVLLLTFFTPMAERGDPGQS